MDLKEFKMAPLYKLDKEWALLTTGNKDKYNTMTVSWGGFGTLWNKPVVTVYIRPNRYTYDLLQDNDIFTLSFYNEDYKKDLGLLGSKSGRNEDKISQTKLNIDFLDKGISFKEAKLTIICKKIYNQDLDINNIDEEIKNKFYSNEPVHKMIIGEVIDIIDNREGDK